jgi:hypothetical protein
MTLNQLQIALIYSGKTSKHCTTLTSPNANSILKKRPTKFKTFFLLSSLKPGKINLNHTKYV